MLEIKRVISRIPYIIRPTYIIVLYVFMVVAIALQLTSFCPTCLVSIGLFVEGLLYDFASLTRQLEVVGLNLMVERLFDDVS